MTFNRSLDIAKLVREFAIENSIPVVILTQQKVVFRKSAIAGLSVLDKKTIREISICGTLEASKKHLFAIAQLERVKDNKELVIKVE